MLNTRGHPVPKITRLLIWLGCLSNGEAEACIRAYRMGFEYSSEAVNNFGGATALVTRAIQLRYGIRIALGTMHIIRIGKLRGYADGTHNAWSWECSCGATHSHQKYGFKNRNKVRRNAMHRHGKDRLHEFQEVAWIKSISFTPNA